MTALSSNKRMIMFLVGCIGVRLMIVLLAFLCAMNAFVMNILAFIALGPAIGFILLYSMGWRTRGFEVGGELIWWNNLRPIHGVLWLAFAITALCRYQYAWTFLLMDVLIGLFAWLFRTFKSLNVSNK